jgi:hypothetical protein
MAMSPCRHMILAEIGSPMIIGTQHRFHEARLNRPYNQLFPFGEEVHVVIAVFHRHVRKRPITNQYPIGNDPDSLLVDIDADAHLG